MESLPIAEIIQTLASIHQTQSQGIISLCGEQEEHFQALLHANAEDEKVLWCLVQPIGTLTATPQISPHNNPETFNEFFKYATKTCDWQAWVKASACYCLPSRQPARLLRLEAGHLATG